MSLDSVGWQDKDEAAVAVNVINTRAILAKAWAEKTRITLEGIAGLIVGLTNMSDGKIAVEILSRGTRKTVYVVAR